MAIRRFLPNRIKLTVVDSSLLLGSKDHRQRSITSFYVGAGGGKGELGDMCAVNLSAGRKVGSIGPFLRKTR